MARRSSTVERSSWTADVRSRRATQYYNNYYNYNYNYNNNYYNDYYYNDYYYYYYSTASWMARRSSTVERSSWTADVRSRRATQSAAARSPSTTRPRMRWCAVTSKASSSLRDSLDGRSE